MEQVKTAHADVSAVTENAPMSKRQQKRQAKMERQEANKRARKEAEKEKKKQAADAKRAAVGEMLQNMTEAERKQWHQEQQEKKQQVWAAKKANKDRQQQALSAPQQVVIDLDFAGLMAPNELKSLCQQLGYSYSAAVNAEQQLHLHLLGATGDLEAALHKQLPGHVHWAATKSSQTFKEFFKDRLDDLVYLTADSHDELEELDTSKIYIIGGIVDRNKHKGICYQRAQEAGIATAKLPIRKHVNLQTSAVITVNQVVDILARVQKTNDWKDVLRQVLPGRKVVEQAVPADTATGMTATEAQIHITEQPSASAPGTVHKENGQQANGTENTEEQQKSRAHDQHGTVVPVEGTAEGDGRPAEGQVADGAEALQKQ